MHFCFISKLYLSDISKALLYSPGYILKHRTKPKEKQQAIFFVVVNYSLSCGLVFQETFPSLPAQHIPNTYYTGQDLISDQKESWDLPQRMLMYFALKLYFLYLSKNAFFQWRLKLLGMTFQSYSLEISGKFEAPTGVRV